MKVYFRGIVFIFIFLVSYYTVSYGQDNRRQVQPQTPPPQSQQPSGTAQQAPATQSSGPILPPVVPSGSSGASPTPSPHISAPSISTGTISTQAQTGSQLPSSITQGIPSAPAQSRLPAVPLHAELVQPTLPIIRNVMGKVLNIATDEDGMWWMEVEDDLFGGTVNIKVVNPNAIATPENRMANISEITIGDTVNVVFNRDRDENVASFIGVVNVEDFEAFIQENQSGLIVTPEKEDSQASE